MTEYLYTQPNLSTGIDDALIETARAVPAFPVMLLVFTFFVVFLGGSSNQKRRIGSADYPFWAVVGGLTITFASLIMTLGLGMIDIGTLGVVIAFTLLCGFWFFLSKVRGEI